MLFEDREMNAFVCFEALTRDIVYIKACLRLSFIIQGNKS